MNTTRFPGRIFIYAGIVLASALLTLLAEQTRFFRLFDLKVQDIHFLFRGPRPTHDIVIVGIDQESLAFFPEPLNLWHPYYADAMRATALGGAKVMALDIIFNSSVAKYEEYNDEIIARAFTEVSPKMPVICAQVVTNYERAFAVPLNFAASSAGAAAFPGLTPDDDNFIRRQKLIEDRRPGVSDDKLLHSLALRTAEAFRGNASRQFPTEPGHIVTINYRGPARTFPYIPLFKVVTAFRNEDRAQLMSWFKDKAVLVGSVDNALGVGRATPFYSAFGAAGLTPGVEIQANTLSTVLTGDFLRPVAGMIEFFALLFAASLCLAAALKPRLVLHKALWAALALFSIVAFTHLLFLAGWMLSTSALLLTYGWALIAAIEIKREEAEQATVAKTEFLAKMSHEIRTPLNAVIGMAEVLASSSLTPEQRKCVEVSQRNGIALLSLINDILDLSKVESGKIRIEATGFDLRDVIAGALEVVAVKAAAKGLWLRHTIDPRVPTALIGDPNRLRQILINLLGNSLKFTESGGIEIRVERDPESAIEGRLRFAVSDTGIGIAPGKVKAVFERYEQADASTARKYGGTGLGLAISRELAELMGGRIWLTSKLGKGTTFFFTAQLAVQSKRREPGEAATRATVAELRERIAGMRILLADDSEDNRFLVTSFLHDMECSIDEAVNGADAVKLFRENAYQAILMDAEMPVMDGFAATREIRRLERSDASRESTPVVALTAHAFADTVAKAHAAGFTEVLTKPLRRITLLEELAKYGGVAVPAPEKAPVTEAIDPDILEAVPGYLEKRRAEVPALRNALSTGDHALIAALAHKLKGTGAGYGFPVLTDIGTGLEDAARRGNKDEISLGIEELARFLATVEPHGVAPGSQGSVDGPP